MICIGSTYEHGATNRWLDVCVSNLEELEKALQDNLNDTKFVFWLDVSNITGEIFPVKDIGHLCHKYNAFYICDATALLGHVAIETNIDDWCDFLVLDGHKAGTELGIGGCWISDRLDKWLNGFKLHGTPNLVGALAMTQAVEDACNISSLEEKQARWMDLSDELYSRLLDVCDGVKQIGNNEGCWVINAIRLPGIDANALQQYLASKRIYIGVGHSSCADNKDFRILQYGYGLSEKEASEVIRISFGENSNETDILALAQGVKEFKEKFV